MEKMNKVDMGYLRVVATKRGVLTDRVITDVSFTDSDIPAGLRDLDNERCYLVKKADLDAFEARVEQLLTTKVKALEAENAYLTRINGDFFKERSKLVEENEALVERNTKLKLRLDKFYGVTSVGEELRAANEKLAAEVADLNKRISHLNVILEYDENRQAALITKNNKLREINNELNAVIVQLRQKLDNIGLTGAYDS